MYNSPMNKRKLIVIIGLAAVFPLIYLYFLLFPVALISPEAAVSSLAVDLNKAAEEKNLRGYISSIENIEGRQDEAIAKLKNDLNAALFAYKKWNVLVGEDDRTAVKDKINLYMNRWKGMLSAETFYRLAQREAGVIREIKYYPLAAWQYVSEEKNLCSLTISIAEFDTKRKVLSLSSKFTHPVFYERMKFRKKVIDFGAYISAGILAVTLFLWSLFSILWAIKRKKTMNNMPDILEQLENYSKQGHFVAAENLALQCMAVLPENTDLIAFKERLDDFCGGNVKKAQIAYVEMLKLKKRIPGDPVGRLPLLAKHDENRIEELLSYSPDLRIVYEQYSKLTIAERSEKQRKAKNYFEDAEAALRNKETRQAEDLLRQALEFNPDFSAARLLLGKIEKTKAAALVTLIPGKTGKEIILTAKDVLIFGRDGADVTIERNKISRRHLKVMLLVNKVLAEDLDSSNGTYHRGEKMSKSQVSDGDIVDLARSYKLVFHICAEQTNESTRMTLRQSQCPVPVADESSENSGIYIEGDSKDILIVKRAIPVDIKVIGMVFDLSGQYKIEFSDGIFFLTGRLKAEPVLLGDKIEVKGISYDVR